MISGKRITLRLFRNEKEVIAITEQFNQLSQRAIKDHTEIYHPMQRIHNFHENGFWSKDAGTLLITTKDDSVIGSINFVKTTDFELSIGYRIFQQKHRQKGYMSEALKLFSAYLFTTIPSITRLMLLTAADNTGSRKLAEKCGYSQEGILRKAYFYRGRLCDWVIYAMLREDSPPLEPLLS